MHVGIDIGTHAARVAALDAEGQPFLVPDRYGTLLMPATVRYTMHGAEVGEYAERFLVSSWETTVRGCGRYLGRYRDLPEQLLATTVFPVSEHEGAPRLHLTYADVAPDEVYALILRQLIAQAEEQLGVKVDEVVIAVPANAEDRYRVLVRQAAEGLGLRVRRLINQPTAALMALGLAGSGGYAAVVDVGAGTTDVSIAALNEGARVLATRGDAHLGAHDLARRVAEGLAARFAINDGIDLRTEAVSKTASLGLLHAAEDALIQLSLAPRTTVAIDHGGGFGRDLYTVLQRQDAEQWMAPDIERITALAQRALSDSGLTAQQIGTVVLIGGGSAIPAVRRGIASVFKRNVGKLVSHTPFAAVACGAALAGTEQIASVWDVTPFPLGINCYYGDEELFSQIVPANAAIPTPSTGQRGAFCDQFQTRYPDQREVRLDILQYRGDKRPATSGPERVFPHECEVLGSWMFSGLTPARGRHAGFSVTFAIDADGILHLVAEETGKRNRLEATVER